MRGSRGRFCLVGAAVTLTATAHFYAPMSCGLVDYSDTDDSEGDLVEPGASQGGARSGSRSGSRPGAHPGAHPGTHPGAHPGAHHHPQAPPPTLEEATPAVSTEPSETHIDEDKRRPLLLQISTRSPPPPIPPFAPTNQSLPAALPSRIDRFLRLKVSGQHFNSSLLENESLSGHRSITREVKHVMGITDDYGSNIWDVSS